MNLKKSLFLGLSLVFYLFLIVTTFVVYFLAEEGFQYENNRTAAAMVVSQVFTGIFGIILLAIVRRNDWHEDWKGLQKNIMIKKGLLAFPLILVSLGSASLFLLFFSYIAPDFVESIMNDDSMSMSGSSGVPLFLILNFTALVIMAPLTEEVFFRAAIFRFLSKKVSLVSGMIVSSLMFGILHFQDPIGAFIFGVVMCIVYHQTSNIWYPIAIHAINNGIVFIFIAFTLGEPFEYYSIDELREQSALLLPVGLIGYGWLIFYIQKNWPSRTANNQMAEPVDTDNPCNPPELPKKQLDD